MRRKMCANLCYFFLYRVFFLFARNILFRIISITFRYFADVFYIGFFFTQRYTIWIFEYAYRCAEKMYIQMDSRYVGTKLNKRMGLCSYRWCFQRFNRMLNLNTDIILIRLDLHLNRVFFKTKIHFHVNRINSMLEPNFGHELDLF